MGGEGAPNPEGMSGEGAPDPEGVGGEGAPNPEGMRSEGAPDPEGMRGDGDSLDRSGPWGEGAGRNVIRTPSVTASAPLFLGPSTC